MTIQLSIDRWNGYHVVVGDQNGKVFYQYKEERNMHEMWPTKEMHLLQSFDGIIEHFALANVYTELQTDQVVDFRDVTDFLYNVRFNEDNIAGKTIYNLGDQDFLQFTSGSSLNMVDTFFQTPAEGLVGGTFAAENQFDGIACNDKHITL